MPVSTGYATSGAESPLAPHRFGRRISAADDQVVDEDVRFRFVIDNDTLEVHR